MIDRDLYEGIIESEESGENKQDSSAGKETGGLSLSL
jgi:hypothetical protein